MKDGFDDAKRELCGDSRVRCAFCRTVILLYLYGFSSSSTFFADKNASSRLYITHTARVKTFAFRAIDSMCLEYTSAPPPYPHVSGKQSGEKVAKYILCVRIFPPPAREEGCSYTRSLVKSLGFCARCCVISYT